MSDDDVIVSTLIGARRRLAAAVFVRAACLAFFTGVAGIALAYLLSPPSWSLTRPLAAAGAAALLIAVAAGWWRWPTLAQTAGALDARLGLRDLTAAAWALRDSRDAMATLVVRDARQRLAAAAIASALPMPRRLATWTSAGSAAALLLAILVGGNSGVSGNLVPAGGAGRVVSGGAAARPRAGAASTAATVTASPRAVPTQATPAARAGGPRTGEPTTPQPPAQSAQSSNRGGGSGARGGSPSTETSPSDSARFGNAGRDATDPQTSLDTAAGGVQRGAIAATVSARPTSRLDTPPTAEDVRQAARRAEAAVDRDEIPPRLKPLIRNYFRSLQSESAR